jgi:SAM-dependent methyltransferase
MKLASIHNNTACPIAPVSEGCGFRMAALERLKWELFTPAMVLLEPLRRSGMRHALGEIDRLCPLAGKRVLEVGAGVGTLLAELVRYDCEVVAIEPSYSMARVARARFPQVAIFEEPADAMRSVADASVDIVLVAATLHGFPPDYRQRVYAELERVTRDAVVVIDYHRNRHLLVALAEWIEGGDYFAFVDVVDEELEQAFGPIEKRRLRSFESIYLARFASR